MQLKNTLTAKAIAAAIAIGYASGASAAIPEPGAVAESWLQLSNFTILEGDQDEGTTTTSLNGGINIIGVTTDANLDIDLNGTSVSEPTPPGIDQPGDPFDSTITIGPGAGLYSPNVLVPFGNVLPENNINPLSYAAAHSSSFGNATDGVTVNNGTRCGDGIVGDCVSTQATVNLTKYGEDGGATSNQNFDASFTFAVADSGWVEMAFDAEAFLRAALGQFGLAANANFDWVVSVSVAGGPEILSWAPDGEVDSDDLSTGSILDCRATNFSGLGADCFEYTDDFALASQNVATGIFPVDSVDAIGGEWAQPKSGSFEVELFLLGGDPRGQVPQFYTLSISHLNGANAAITVPEPTTLALLGLGLLGAGYRRKQQ